MMEQACSDAFTCVIQMLSPGIFGDMFIIHHKFVLPYEPWIHLFVAVILELV
jgi:hypothetical protein